MSKAKHKCPYNGGLTEEDNAALSWLNDLVARGAETCGPEVQQFHAAYNAVGKLFNKLHEQHDMLHAKDAELRRAETITAGLLGLSPAVREDETVN